MGVTKNRRPVIDENSRLGWGDFLDTEHTDFDSGQQVSSGVWTIMGCNGAAGVQSFQPTGVTLFEPGTARGDVITGRRGDGILVTTEFSIDRETNSGQFNLECAYDIGGSFTELFHRFLRLQGGGEVNITFTTAMYTLDTWQENGALFKIQTSVPVRIFNMRHMVHRHIPGPLY